MTRTIGSLFTGMGGLDMAVHQVLDADTVWVSEIEPGACRVLEHRMPGVPNLGDVTRIDWSRVPRVDVLTGGSPCFAAGTPVLTHDGLRPIEDVQVGDLVWTHAARWQRVTHTMRRTSETVQFRSGFYCTPEHRLWLRAPQQRRQWCLPAAGGGGYPCARRGGFRLPGFWGGGMIPINAAIASRITADRSVPCCRAHLPSSSHMSCGMRTARRGVAGLSGTMPASRQPAVQLALDFGGAA